MKHRAQILVRLYARLLALYPRRYRADYGEELQTVFSLVVNEAVQRGRFSVIRLGWRELRDLPGAVIREYLREGRKRKMETSTITPTGAERSSWGETLAGLWPFLFLGPVSVIIMYMTVPAWFQYSEDPKYLLFIVFVLSMLVGLGVGWAKGWPRWSYPYLGFAMIVGGLAIGGTVSSMVFTVGPEWPVLPQVLIAVGVFGLTVGILTLIARAWRPLHSLYRSIRQDWTRLSFGLFPAVLVIFGTVDLDEDPIFTLNVFVPSLIVLAGALVYLHSTTKAQRVLALLVSLTLAVAVRVVGGNIFYATYYATYGAVVGVIVFIPALLELLPRPAKSLQAG